MKYCPNCGTPAEDMQAFCTNCGCKLPEKPGTGNHRESGKNRTDSNYRAADGNQADGNGRADVHGQADAGYRKSSGGRSSGNNGWGSAASGRSGQKGLAMGIAIGIVAAVAAFVLFFRGGGQDKKPEAPSASRGISVDSSVVSDRGSGSDPAFEADQGEGSAVHSQTGQETAGADQIEKTPLKQGVTEGNNTFVHKEGKLVFFPHRNMLWSALIAEDGSLYDFCQDATFAENIQSVAIVGTELIVSTSLTLYRTDMNTYQSGSGKLEEIIGDGTDMFSVYDGYVYYLYGYKMYRVPLQGGEKTALAESVTDYEVTNQGLFISGDNGETYWLSYDGGEKKRLFSRSGKTPYLSAGADTIYVRYEDAQDIDVYTVSTQAQDSLILPSWTGGYASLYDIHETPSGLIYQGGDGKAYRYDPATGIESRVGKDFGMPTIDVAFAGETCYWSNIDGVYWCRTALGEKGSYEPEKDGGGTDSAGGGSSAAGSVVETELFQVTVPESWAGKVTYKIYKRDYQEYTVAFYQKSGQEAIEGGHLFSISLYMEGSEEPENLPSFETLGRLIYKPAEVYIVGVEYPTDVQFTAEGEAEYRALREDVEGVLDTLTVDSTYEFQKS